MRVGGLAQSLARGGLLCATAAAVVHFMTGRCLDGILRASLWQQSMGMYFELCLAPGFSVFSTVKEIIGLFGGLTSTLFSRWIARLNSSEIKRWPSPRGEHGLCGPERFMGSLFIHSLPTPTCPSSIHPPLPQPRRGCNTASSAVTRNVHP